LPLDTLLDNCRQESVSFFVGSFWFWFKFCDFNSIFEWAVGNFRFEMAL
jgi:hypothetical protein